MELNKAASALASAWQSASHFTCDKYCLNMLAKIEGLHLRRNKVSNSID